MISNRAIKPVDFPKIETVDDDNGVAVSIKFRINKGWDTIEVWRW